MPEMKRDGHKHVAQWDDVKERACERFMNSTPPVLSRFFQLRDKCKKRGRREQLQYKSKRQLGLPDWFVRF